MTKHKDRSEAEDELRKRNAWDKINSKKVEREIVEEDGGFAVKEVDDGK